MTRASRSGGYERPAHVSPSPWPGWTDNPDGTCCCTWAVRGGVWQVKFANAGCTVRHAQQAAVPDVARHKREGGDG